MIGLIYFTVFATFQLLYMALSIDKMDGGGLSNTAHHEYLPKKIKVMQQLLAIEKVSLLRDWSIKPFQPETSRQFTI